MTPLDAGKDVGKLGHSYIADGNVKQNNCYVKQFGNFFKN